MGFCLEIVTVEIFSGYMIAATLSTICNRFGVVVSMVKRYRTVKLPYEMIAAVEELIRAHPEYGYASLADFIKDSVRHHYVWHVHKIRFKKEKN